MNKSLILGLCSVLWVVGMAGRVAAGPAATSGAVCELVEPDFITVDGMIDDWRGIHPVRANGLSRDASFSVACAHDATRLYVSLMVRDDQVARRPGKQPQAKQEDHLLMRLQVADSAAAELLVFPGANGIEPRRTWNRGAVPSGVEVEDTLQQRGWSMELAVPLDKIAGLSKSSPGLSASITYRDADGPGQGQGLVALNASLTFRAAADLFRSFLQATKLSRQDIQHDILANVDDQPGAERVIAGGTVLGVLSDRFSYISLPVQAASDISRVEVVDLRGDGTSSILTEFRQHGNGGSRDLVVIWGVNGQGGLDRLLAIEVRKELDGNVLVNRWSLVPRGELRGGPRQAAGRDLLVEVSAADVKGWNEDNYQELPAPDVRPILTPWSDQTSAVFSFEGNAVVGGEPKVAPRGPKKRGK